jgi:hypothetical protein
MTVAYAFDTLGYAKRLRDAGVPNPQAEAHAEAAREFIMTELVTKQDLQVQLQVAIDPLRAAITALEARIDTQTLRLTVRLGGIVVAGFGILAVAIGTFALFVRLH